MSEIKVEPVDGVTVVGLDGEHDLATSDELRSRIDEALTSGSPLVVDLSGTSFVDSSIIGVLLAAFRATRERGTGFALAVGVDHESAVYRILETAGLIGGLPIEDELSTAIERVSADRAPSGKYSAP